MWLMSWICWSIDRWSMGGSWSGWWRRMGRSGLCGWRICVWCMICWRVREMCWMCLRCVKEWCVGGRWCGVTCRRERISRSWRSRATRTRWCCVSVVFCLMMMKMMMMVFEWMMMVKILSGWWNWRRRISWRRWKFSVRRSWVGASACALKWWWCECLLLMCVFDLLMNCLILMFYVCFCVIDVWCLFFRVMFVAFDVVSRGFEMWCYLCLFCVYIFLCVCVVWYWWIVLCVMLIVFVLCVVCVWV